VLDEERCQILVQQDAFIVNQGDMIILEGEKYGGTYKLKEENIV